MVIAIGMDILALQLQFNCVLFIPGSTTEISRKRIFRLTKLVLVVCTRFGRSLEVPCTIVPNKNLTPENFTLYFFASFVVR
jgi:hypothetical protein